MFYDILYDGGGSRSWNSTATQEAMGLRMSLTAAALRRWLESHLAIASHVLRQGHPKAIPTLTSAIHLRSLAWGFLGRGGGGSLLISEPVRNQNELFFQRIETRSTAPSSLLLSWIGSF